MNLDEYQQLAKRTATHPDPNADIYELAALGILGETGEICDLIKKHKYHAAFVNTDQVKKECGDLMWYLALACTITGNHMGVFSVDTDVVEANPISMAVWACDVAQVLHSHRILAFYPMSHCLAYLGGIANAYGFTLEDAAETNIEKLKRRYPDGFDLQRAANHDSE